MSAATAPSGVRAARDVVALLAAVQASDPGRPRLTWYGADGERVELSARVLATWVAKTANLLVEELDAGPGSSVVLHLPPHWRSAVWALAAWSVGAELGWVQDAAAPDAAAAAAAPADVLVTTSPDGARPAPGGWVVAVALPALARSFSGDLAGALDYAAVVAGFGDTFEPSPDGAAPLPQPVRTRWPDGIRLLTVGAGVDLGADLLGALLADGSLVLCEIEPSPGVIEAERVTARSGDPAG